MEVISLDVFDTAIRRRVYNPTDLFKIINPKFCTRRIMAEKQARRIINRECNIYDIYNCIKPKYKENIHKELELELELCYANNEILNLYNEEILKGNRVIFISDMYLPSEFIKKMLIKCGYNNPEVYVSNEYGDNKSNNLFNIIEEKLGVKISRHYGDNYKSEIERLRYSHISPNLVINTSLIKHPIIDRYNNTFWKKYMADIINDNNDSKIIMASYFGILQYYFVKSIIEEANGSKILFNSRDGYNLYLIAKRLLNYCQSLEKRLKEN